MRRRTWFERERLVVVEAEVEDVEEVEGKGGDALWARVRHCW